MEPEAGRVNLPRRILAVLEETGKREPALLRRMFSRFSDAEFQRAIGYLVLKGLILFRGQTTGRTVGINGRRKTT